MGENTHIENIYSTGKMAQVGLLTYPGIFTSFNLFLKCPNPFGKTITIFW
jgi:hypothetical protein